MPINELDEQIRQFGESHAPARLLMAVSGDENPRDNDPESSTTAAVDN
jgi:hypothetical protein